MTTFTDALGYITGEATDTEVRALFEAGNQRLRTLRTLKAAENIANLSPGQQVKTEGLRPKYLNGLTGTVDTINGTNVLVKLDDASVAQAGYRYVSALTKTIRVPASTLILV